MIAQLLAAHDDTRVPAGGAPSAGTGSIKFNGFVRIVDGGSVEIRLNGNQVAVGLVGIETPQGNTACGKEAVNLLRTMIPDGIQLRDEIQLDEEPGYSYDARKRRMYHLSYRGKSLAVELLRAGVVSTDSKGKQKKEFIDAEKDAKSSSRGCIGRGDRSALVPLTHDNPVQTMISAGSSYQTTASKAAASASSSPLAASLQSGFVLDVLASGLNTPTNFAFLPDGRVLIAEQSGLVRMYKNGAILSAPFIDIRNRVNAYWDHGLLGIAVDPNFANNGYVYLLYTYENDPLDYSGPKTARLTRVTATGDTAAPASEVAILGKTVGAGCKGFPAGTDCVPSENPSHSIGSVKFAADGTMFVTTGDGASFNVVDDDALRAQDLDSLAGKILHITTAGAGIATNPFWNGSASANRSKVWAYGLRNPYRFNLRPGSSTIYLGDVGWSSYEEINAGQAGANFGWPCYEGNYRQGGYEPKALCQSMYSQIPSPVTFAILPWAHTGGSFAATGGTFYSGTAYPVDYQGSYFFGDYGQSTISNLRVDANNNVIGGPFDFVSAADGPVAIEMGADQNLYYIAINTGELRRIRYVPSLDNTPPTIVSQTPVSGAAGVATGIKVKATFSEGMNAATFTTATFNLIKQGTTTPIAASLAYDVPTRTATLTPSVPLSLATTYVATVKGGFSGVTDSASNPLAADQVWSFVSAVPPPAGTSYLSDLPWTSMTNGWGPVERDKSNGDLPAGDGATIILNGQTFPKGLGAHANSDVRFFLGGRCSAFAAEIGIDDDVGSSGSVIFQVMADGTKIFDSGVMFGWSATQSVNVDVTGRNEVALVINEAADGIGSDHGDWASARITCTASSDTTPPTVNTVNPAAGATSVPTDTVVTAAFSEAINPSTVTTTNFTLVKQGTTTPVSGSVTYDASVLSATLTPNVPLQIATTYTATVKGGSLGVKDVAGNALAADKVWSFTTSNNNPVTTRYLSNMAWSSMTNGWGPVEKDKTNGDSAAGDGTPIQLGGTVYPKGLGGHAMSDVRYLLGGGCSTFTAQVGVDDDAGDNGSVVFQVLADGVQIFDSGVLFGWSPTKSVALNITGKNELALIITDGGDGNGWDHGDWADAKVTCGGFNTPPVPTIATPSSTLRWKVGDVITFSGSATDSEDGSIPPASLSWLIRLHHCPGGDCHLHPFTSATGAGGSFTAPDHGDESYFELILTATDSAGLTGTASVSIQPLTTQLTLNTSPPGLQVVYGGVTGTAPLVRNPIVGSTLTIYTPPQSPYTFSSWSDGGSQQHNVVVGTTATTYTATFASTAPPTANTLTPAAGTTNVSVNTSVTGTFSNLMNSATVTNATFTLVKQGNTTPITATVSYNAATVTATLTPSAPLQTATAYTATVKGGATGVKDTAGNSMVSDVVWTFTTSSTAPPITRYLSDMTWSSMTNGWGPVEKDKANGDLAAGDGGPITLAGVVYPKGLGAHASSDVRYLLGGSCSTFAALVGVDDDAGDNGSVIFQVLADGVKIYDSGVIFGWTLTQGVNLNVAGKNELALIITNGGDGAGWDHGDWADAKVTCSSQDTTPPTLTGTTPAAAATNVALDVSPAAAFSEPVDATSLTAATFTLLKQGTSTPLTATVSYNAATATATLTPSAPLQTATTYTATVKGGATGVKDTAGNPMAADVVWTFTTSSTVPPTTRYLSDMTWSSMTNGWGPVEKDKANGDLAAGDGGPIKLDGVVYPKGLGAHASSDVRYLLGGSCSTFAALVGVDDDAGDNGSVIFQVLADGVKIYDSGVIFGWTLAQSVNLNIAGKNELALIITNGGDGAGWDHGDWADAKVTCSSQDTTPPTITTRSPAANATSVAVNAGVSAVFSKAMNAATITTTTFTLIKQGASTPTAAAVSYTAATNTATLQPSAALSANSVYNVTVKGGASGVKDTAGNALATDALWSFTTQ